VSVDSRRRIDARSTVSRVLQAAALVALVFFRASFDENVVSTQDGCTSIQPAADWVCLNGGWLPPNHPLVTGGAAPPPNPPASCATIQPAAGWLCVNGGWLPPGSSLPGGAPPPTVPASCPTVQPAADWVCVNGGWLPPGFPLLNPGPLQPSSSHQLLMVDPAHAAMVRESLRRGEPQFQPALSALVADANRALTLAPISVMDKGVTPPSGDKHDYMSQAPYWWPDPSEPDGKPYIRRDGRRNPEIDRITDHQNLAVLARAVTTLTLGFYFTGREDYAQHAARLLEVWFLDPATRMNPHLQFAQGIPGIAEGRASGIIESRWLADIVGAASVLDGSAAWSASDDGALKAWMRAYLTWLLESPLGREEARKHNNQVTWYEVQVVALAIYTGQHDVGRTMLDRARAAIAEEFEPDGRQPRELERTRAWDYSIFNLSAFVELAELGTLAGVDLWNYRTADGRSIRQGIEFLIPFATGTRRFPYEQITEFEPSALGPILRAAAGALNQPRYLDIAREIGRGAPRLDLTLP
jgi:Alginate lyase